MERLREYENSEPVVSATVYHSPGMALGPVQVMMTSVGVSTLESSDTAHVNVRLVPAYKIPSRSEFITTPGSGTAEN